MTCIRPAGRRGACSCGNQYAQILDRLDTVEQEASDAKTTAQTAANTASIQAVNAAADAAQAASDAGDALTQATAAAASAAAAALDAGNAAADLASINSTISTTLATYLGTKVDKLTTTGSFAYTHINATQGETALVDGTTSNTIPIRDASGYLKAASPATGVYDTNLANGTKVKNELDNYAPMVRTTGNQNISGTKSIVTANISYLAISGTDFQRRVQINRTDDNANTPPLSAITYPLISWNDANLSRVCALQVNHLTNGSYELRAVVRNADGTDKYVTLLGGNP